MAFVGCFCARLLAMSFASDFTVTGQCMSIFVTRVTSAWSIRIWKKCELIFIYLRRNEKSFLSMRQKFSHAFLTRRAYIFLPCKTDVTKFQISLCGSNWLWRSSFNFTAARNLQPQGHGNYILIPKALDYASRHHSFNMTWLWHVWGILLDRIIGFILPWPGIHLKFDVFSSPTSAEESRPRPVY